MRKRKGFSRNASDDTDSLPQSTFLAIHNRLLASLRLQSEAGSSSMKLGSRKMRAVLQNDSTLLLMLIVFRLMNSLLVQTWYVADEFWQSLEIAHLKVFGTGIATWEWKVGIRSYLYPSIFITFYKFLLLLRIDYAILLIKGPRFVQAIFAALTDYYVYKFAKIQGGLMVGQWALFCQLTSWYTFYTSTRTLSNCMETFFTSIAIFWYPLVVNHLALSHTEHFAKVNHWKYVIPMSFAFIIRPTAVIQFFPMCVYHAVHILRNYPSAKAIGLFSQILATFVTIFYFNHWLDNLIYSQFTVASFNFVKFNLFGGVASFYGTHPFYWYITNGLPELLFTHSLPIICSYWLIRLKRDHVWISTILFTLLVYSGLPHKETRFLMPLMPIFMYFASLGMTWMWQLASSRSGKSMSTYELLNNRTSRPIPLDSKDSPPIPKAPSVVLNNLGNALLIILLLSNLPMALYFSLVHQRGPLDAVNFVRHYVDAFANVKKEQLLISANSPSTWDRGISNPSPPYPIITANGVVPAKFLLPNHYPSVFFLMPCHSTPFHSHVHIKNDTFAAHKRFVFQYELRFLTCEPNIQRARYSGRYKDEADIFFDDPMAYLNAAFPQTSSLPTMVVFFSKLKGSIDGWLSRNCFGQCAKFFHTHLTTHRQHSQHILAFCRQTNCSPTPPRV